MNQPILTPALTALLQEWLPRQRWFPVKTPGFEVAQAGSLGLEDPSGHAALAVFLLKVTTKGADGGRRTEVVQVPLSFRPAPAAGMERALIGEAAGTDPSRPWVYDAVHDPDFVGAWLELMRGGEQAPSGTAAGFRSPGDHKLPTARGVVKVLSGEQSNTSVIVDDGEAATIVKFFRVLSEGTNPEVEVGAALTSAGTAEVPATLGWVRGEWLAQGVPSPDGTATGSRHAEGELAVAHEFLAGGLDAWRLAVDAARSGTDFTAEARALGAATATVHRRLAEALGQSKEAEPGKVIAPGVAQRVRQAWAEAASAVGPYDAALDNLLDGLDGVPAGPLQRIHGDLHLGQILQVPGQAGEPARWAILDFEGEPLRPDCRTQFSRRSPPRRGGNAPVLRLRRRGRAARAGRRTGGRLVG
jgi:1,4-alpha-glucan branching enzyme